MEPRPGVTYATIYYKQTDAQRQQLIVWLSEIGQDINAIMDRESEWYAWLNQPLKRFRKSQRGQYYTALELFTDMLGQLLAGKDLPEAMVGRWNRLCEATPWTIEMTDQTRPTPLYQNLFVPPTTPKTPKSQNPQVP
jgi:hypothetical protein